MREDSLNGKKKRRLGIAYMGTRWSDWRSENIYVCPNKANKVPRALENELLASILLRVGFPLAYTIFKTEKVPRTARP
jgi:hypothetical protein